MSSPQIFLFNRRKLILIDAILNIESIDLVDKITLIDLITKISEITKIDEIIRIVNIGDNVQPRPLTSRRRTGRVFYVDTFEDYYDVITEKWKQEDAFGTIGLATDYPKDGASCMKLITGTAENNYAWAYLYFGLFPSGKFGFEFEFQCSEGATNIRDIRFGFFSYTGTRKKQGGFKWQGETNKKLQYQNSGVGWADIDAAAEVSSPSLDLYIESTLQPMYHNIKMIYDFDTDKYVKLLIDEIDYDISDLSGSNVENTDFAAHHRVYFILYNAVATAARIGRIDNVILTDQEP